MQTTVNLQELFTYSLIPLIIVVLFIILFTCYLIYSKQLRSKFKEEPVKKLPNKNIKNIPVIKEKYLQKLDDIEDKYRHDKIRIREAYQLVSETIRLFVFEVTDITTQNYSLYEIRNLNIPKLYELIEEYYEPEFAFKSVGDFDSSINKARRVINEWK